MKLIINWKEVEADNDLFERLKKAKKERENMFKVQDKWTIIL